MSVVHHVDVPNHVEFEERSHWFGITRPAFIESICHPYLYFSDGSAGTVSRVAK